MMETIYEPTGLVPNTAEEALRAWDAGEPVQSVEMGGMGFGYEMAIQTVAFELIRILLIDPELIKELEETPKGQAYSEDFGKRLDEVALAADAKDENGHHKLGGLSGAQVGAAKNIAVNLVRHGYENARRRVPDRMIFVRQPGKVE
jgi:hypothetical protein